MQLQHLHEARADGDDREARLLPPARRGGEPLDVRVAVEDVEARFFCNTCGVYCFGRGHLEQLGGDFVSVNLNCLDDVELARLTVVHWDGRHDNWQVGPRATPWPVS